MLLIAPAGVVPPGYVAVAPRRPEEAPRPPDPVPSPVAATDRSYAWKLAIPDGVAAGLLSVGLVFNSAKPMLLGVPIYALGAPIVHLTEGNVGRGALSLGVRVGLPTAAVAGTLAICPTRTYSEAFGCALLAILTGGFGVGGAVVIDYVLMSNRPAPPTPPATARWSPTLVPGKDGVTLGMVGTW